MNVQPYPIKTNDYKDNEITKVVMKHSNKGEYHKGFGDGRDVTLCAVLEILDEVSSDSSVGGEYWNSAKTIKVLRRRFMALKVGE